MVARSLRTGRNRGSLRVRGRQVNRNSYTDTNRRQRLSADILLGTDPAFAGQSLQGVYSGTNPQITDELPDVVSVLEGLIVNQTFDDAEEIPRAVYETHVANPVTLNIEVALPADGVVSGIVFELGRAAGGIAVWFDSSNNLHAGVGTAADNVVLTRTSTDLESLRGSEIKITIAYRPSDSRLIMWVNDAGVDEDVRPTPGGVWADDSGGSGGVGQKFGGIASFALDQSLTTTTNQLTMFFNQLPTVFPSLAPINNQPAQNLQAPALLVTDDGFGLTWEVGTVSPTDTRTGQQVFIDGAPQAVGADDVSATIAGLDPFVSYNVFIRALYTTGAPEDSAAIDVVTQQAAAIAASSLSASAITQTSAQIDWTLAVPPTAETIVDQFLVIDGNQTAGLGAVATSSVASGLVADTAHSIVVRTSFSGGGTIDSTALAVQTLANVPAVAASSLVASAITETGFTISWTLGSPPTGAAITGQAVFLDGVPQPPPESASATSRVLTGLTAGTTYAVTVLTSFDDSSSILSSAVNVDTTSASNPWETFVAGLSAERVFTFDALVNTDEIEDTGSVGSDLEPQSGDTVQALVGSILPGAPAGSQAGNFASAGNALVDKQTGHVDFVHKTGTFAIMFTMQTAAFVSFAMQSILDNVNKTEAGSEAGFNLAFTPGAAATGQFEFVITNNGGFNTWFARFPNVFAAALTPALFIINGDGSDAKLYRDGVEIAASSSFFSTLPTEDSLLPLGIGANGGDGGNDLVDSVLDELVILDRSMTPQEIADAQTNGFPA